MRIFYFFKIKLYLDHILIGISRVMEDSIPLFVDANLARPFRHKMLDDVDVLLLDGKHQGCPTLIVHRVQKAENLKGLSISSDYNYLTNIETLFYNFDHF